MRALGFDVYVLTDPRAERGLSPYLEAARANAPRVAIGLRDHDASLASLERDLRALLDAVGGRAPVLVAASSIERVELAARLGAGVHLPERGPSAELARALLGARAPLLASIHDEAGLDRRAREGVDGVVLAPFGPVPGKGAPLGAEAIEAITRRGVPTLALGAIRGADDVARALGLGACGVALRSLFASTRDGAALVAEVRRWVDGAREREARRPR